MRSVMLLAALATAGAAAAATGAPALKVVTRRPLVVSGSRFHVAERVRVSAGAKSVIVRTTRLGTFRADLGNVPGDRCTLRVVAVGAAGERVTLRAEPMCPMP